MGHKLISDVLCLDLDDLDQVETEYHCGRRTVDAMIKDASDQHNPLFGIDFKSPDITVFSDPKPGCVETPEGQIGYYIQYHKDKTGNPMCVGGALLNDTDIEILESKNNSVVLPQMNFSDYRNEKRIEMILDVFEAVLQARTDRQAFQNLAEEMLSIVEKGKQDHSRVPGTRPWKGELYGCSINNAIQDSQRNGNTDKTNPLKATIRGMGINEGFSSTGRCIQTAFQRMHEKKPDFLDVAQAWRIERNLSIVFARAKHELSAKKDVENRWTTVEFKNGDAWLIPVRLEIKILIGHFINACKANKIPYGTKKGISIYLEDGSTCNPDNTRVVK